MHVQITKYVGYTLMTLLLAFVLAACGGSTGSAIGESSATAVPGSLLWGYQLGTSSSDTGFAVTLDYDGHVIIGGWTAGLLGAQKYGNQDAYVSKITIGAPPSVGPIWTSQFGAATNNIVYDAAVTSTGSIAVTGATKGPLVSGQYAGETDAFVRLSSSDGTVQWILQLGSDGNDGGQAIKVTEDGNLLVAGYIQGTLGPGGDITGSDNLDAFVMKLNVADGTFMWGDSFGSSANESVRDMAIDTDGNIILVGHTTGSLPGETSSGNEDVIIRKYSPTGNELWTRQFGTAGADYGWAVAVDPYDDAIIVSGEVRGALPSQQLVGNADAFIRKYSRDGTELWTTQFGTLANDSIFGIGVDPADRSIVVGGTTFGSLPGATTLGNRDAFVRKYAQDGTTVLWTDQFGTEGVDLINNLTVTDDGLTFVIGLTEGNLHTTNSGKEDIFIRMYNR